MLSGLTIHFWPISRNLVTNRFVLLEWIFSLADGLTATKYMFRDKARLIVMVGKNRVDMHVLQHDYCNEHGSAQLPGAYEPVVTLVRSQHRRD